MTEWTIAVTGSRLKRFRLPETNALPDHVVAEIVKLYGEGVSTLMWMLRYDNAPTNILLGGAQGVDTTIQTYFLAHELVLPDPSGPFPQVLHRRNQEMVDRADAVLAIWDGFSPGTRSTIDKALDAGKPFHVEYLLHLSEQS